MEGSLEETALDLCNERMGDAPQKQGHRMSRGDEIIGVVEEERPNQLYLVKMEDGSELLCYLGGKLKFKKIHVGIGDKVRVLPDPYKGTGTNRITWRL